MQQTLKLTIPVDVQIKRLENHIEMMRRELAALPFWKIRQRWILGGVIATYRYELDYLMEWCGRLQLEHLLKSNVE